MVKEILYRFETRNFKFLRYSEKEEWIEKKGILIKMRHLKFTAEHKKHRKRLTIYTSLPKYYHFDFC